MIYKNMHGYIFGVSKQVVLAYKCVILGETALIDNLFFSLVCSTYTAWSQAKYLEFSLKNLEKIGILHQKPWENQEFGLKKKVRTLNTYIS